MSRKIDFTATWDRLSDTVSKIISEIHLPRSVWTERFSDIYSVCIAYPETLNQDLYKETRSLLRNHIHNLYKEVSSAESELLYVYAKHWIIYSKGARYLDLLYHHFNQQYVNKLRHSAADIEYGHPLDPQQQMLEIGELALESWKSIMIEPLKGRLMHHILHDILQSRQGKEVNEKNACTTVHSFITVDQHKKKQPLEFYEELFEKFFLEETGTFYKTKALQLLENSTYSDYMKHILSLLTEEARRSQKFLYHSSYKKAATECQQRLILDHILFLKAGCRQMIRHDRKKDLLHMYMLLKSAPEGLNHMVSELETHIRETGVQLVENIEDGNIPVQFVETVLEVHAKFDGLVRDLFNSDKHFVSALDRACVAIVNHSKPRQPCRAPELVCKYCDNILRRCAKGTSEEADEKLKRSITVFRYIEDKDVFQKFYGRALAKRLIHMNCVMDFEEQMINRLKDVCGYDFTSKLHSMFSNIRISGEHTKEFHKDLNNKGEILDTNFNINILQHSAWPLNSATSELILPEVLIKCVQKFEHFYSAKFNGRNLTWLHHLSFVEVTMQVSTKSYFITMSSYQCAILLLFNQDNELTMKEITSSTKLKGRELEKNVAVLVESKILLKNQNNEITSEECMLAVNENYANKRTRFKIAMAQTHKEQATDVQQTRSSVDEDRKHYLLAAVVRIMKARKAINHNSLVEEVITKSRMRFTPSVSAIKKTIESLIEKSYIERSPDAPDIYRCGHYQTRAAQFHNGPYTTQIKL